MISSSENPKLVPEMNESISKSIFESLDMEIQDGKPKFRLNESTFSAVNMKHQMNLPSEDDDDTSFVVLGKSSLDSINLASLADYEQIQQKSMNVDCNSILSTLCHEQIESKVTELLQENIKLKETLTRNNAAMKHHFNTLITWQNELIKVHGNHKQKFVETCDMIASLKKECAELKEKLSTMESRVAFTQFSGEMVENSPAQNKGNSIVDAVDLVVDNKDNSTPMNSITSNTSKLQGLSCDCSEEHKCLKIREKHERDIHYQQEIILSLKEQLRNSNENSFLFLKEDIKHSLDRPPELNRSQFFEHYTRYNQKLNDLAKCYSEQTSRFLNIQDCLKRCIDSLEIHKDYKNLSSPSIIEETEQVLKDCRKKLIEEQLLNISDRQNLIKAQHQFQQIFSDYNSTLHGLEILQAESSKPSQKDYELEKEKQELEKMSRELENKQKQLELSKKNMDAERLLFQMEKETLNEEKSSLNSQCLLYESQIKTSNDKLKELQATNDHLKSTIETLKATITNDSKKLEKVYADLESARKDSELINYFRQQLKIFESDFQEEKQAKNELLREREQLTEQLAKLRDHNQNLLQRINGPNPTRIPTLMDQIPNDAFCPECGLFKMPGQWHGPGFCQPTD
ncbi:optineurin-like [Chelonus insularis]|uniref:optineurin-like n=1 Tax=Chelonus insularis TaxID=460826 RepID=UPI00158838AD|nr:optineurin-like [Chelonus insularis]XP_034936545.1 optineurin-like [Chelonus insularis]XP_034936546.1 optineurin-like [Chelonus insularis]